MSDEITISKKNLWMYSTFILLAIVIIGGIWVFTTRNTPTGEVVVDNVDLDVFLTDLYPSVGPENAKNVVIEFSDFQCPYCALTSGLPSWAEGYKSQYSDMVGIGEELRALAETGELRFVYVPMSFLGYESVYATEAALCAKEQGKFWEMYEAIFKASTGPTENDGKYTKDKLKLIAKSISGLDLTEFNSCLDNEETLSSVETISTEASKVASGTPVFYVNGEKMSASWSKISAALK